MNYYKDIPFWENKKRQELLIEYTEKFKKYANLVDFDPYKYEPIETDESLELRSWINKRIPKVNPIVYNASVYPTVTYTPPRSIGGYVQQINILENYALLYQYDIPPIEVVDVLEKALGVYEADYRSAVIRTFNPFFWIGKVLNFIASIPFKVISSLGIEKADKIEESFYGRLVKLIIKIAVSFKAVWEFLQFLGVLTQGQTVLNFVQNLVH